MTLRWFISKTVREAAEVSDRVRKLFNAQRDILPAVGLQAISEGLAAVHAGIATKASDQTVRMAAYELDQTAAKWLRPYPYPAMRENVDVILVALAIALAIRTFFLQPMAIPTGSMQPTLYGNTAQDLRGMSQAEIPNPAKRIWMLCVNGVRFLEITARSDGEFRGFERTQKILGFISLQHFQVGTEIYTVWFPPEGFENSARLIPGQNFRAGQPILKMMLKSGDRLFADRFTYNFRRPQRGEIVIFETTGISGTIQGTHYIKRLVGLGGERLRILNDRHVEIDGKRLDVTTPGFENLYAFRGPPMDSTYSGHLNGAAAREFDSRAPIPPLFPDESTVREIEPHHYLVLGDNTVSSSDSRYWGTFPENKIVGRCGFVFWPISSRFGWGFH